jgi:hypothetical protein
MRNLTFFFFIFLQSCFNSQNSFSNDKREDPFVPVEEVPTKDWFTKVQSILNSPRHCCLDCHSFPETEAEFFDPNNELISADRDPNKSPLFLRAHTTDQELIMPPPGEGDPLSADEIAMLKKWIERGSMRAEESL